MPPGSLPELFDGVSAIGRRHSVTVGTFGDAGDGNMRPTIVYDPADPEP